jgi:hypothetical protein
VAIFHPLWVALKKCGRVPHERSVAALCSGGVRETGGDLLLAIAVKHDLDPSIGASDQR